MRQVYVLRDGSLVPKREAEAIYAAPMVIRDGMDDLRHPVTGEMFDSKSKFRQTTKAAGCIELGNDRFTPSRPTEADVRNDVHKAVQMLHQGYRPDPIPQSQWGGKGEGWK